jgi:RNA polymerase sigma factor (sigma-70 family)
MQGRSRRRSLGGSALRAQPDRRLVRLAREGHDAAMEEIVRRYRPALVGFAARIVPPHRAEDVVQESLARAMIALVDGEQEIKLKPWLYAIVRNRALNDLRDERTHEPIPDDFDGAPQPPEVVARREEVASLVGAIAGLPAGQREALVQREMEGRSHEEIAAGLGSTPGAVRGLIFRARIALRDAVGLVVPLPVVRWLLTEEGAPAAMAAGAGGAAAAGAAAGGGGIAAKTGVGLVVAAFALGSGVTLREQGRDAGAEAASSRAETANGAGSASSGSSGIESGPGSSASSGPSERSGPGGGDDERDDDSGPGGGDDDNSGPGGGDDDNSGPGGGGGDELEVEREDHSGPGGGGSGSGSSGPSSEGDSGSGSGISGSGSSGSGSSGSGSSGGGEGEPDGE